MYKYIVDTWVWFPTPRAPDNLSSNVAAKKQAVD